MHLVISYDIEGNRRRRKVAKILEGAGWRVQYSVFEAHLTTEQLKDLKQRLRKATHRKWDSIRIYHLCGECSKRVYMMGAGSRVEQPGTLVV